MTHLFRFDLIIGNPASSLSRSLELPRLAKSWQTTTGLPKLLGMAACLGQPWWMQIGSAVFSRPVVADVRITTMRSNRGKPCNLASVVHLHHYRMITKLNGYVTLSLLD